MKFAYTSSALRDLKDWKKQHDQEVIDIIKDIEREIAIDPTATGGKYKPEKLKHELSGWYSRRITQVDRFVYRPSPDDPDIVEVVQCKGHY
ncbi:MAG: Txe/YoeB family addiction module toxin [Coriobacteriales bacterium]|jgi:toxin YoeB|nr:Txe/YoeB family addiction module toxin [Coriobacteriales bacterium]